MTTMKTFALPALVLCCMAAASVCWADVYVVTSARSSLRSVAAKDIQALYMGRKVMSHSGLEQARAVDLERDHPVRASFYTSLTGMSVAQVNSYWARLMFSGQTLPPPTVPSEQTMVEYLLKHQDAVGYLSAEPVDNRLRVLTVLRTAPGQTEAAANAP